MGVASRSAEWTIELFGGLRARHAEREIARFRTHKTAALLAYLVYYRSRPHTRDSLIDLLWGDGPPEAGRQSLSKALSSLRRQFEPPGLAPGSVLLADRRFIRMSPACVTTDVARFETALSDASRARDPVERVQRLMEAVQFHRGELLPGFYEEWVLRERERLRELLHQTLCRLISHFEQVGDLDRALEYARAAASADPLREEARAELIRLLAARGEPAEALQEYQKLERMLREELALSPSARTRALVASLPCGPGTHERRAGSLGRCAASIALPARAERGEGALARAPCSAKADGLRHESRLDDAFSRRTSHRAPRSAPQALPSGIVTFLVMDWQPTPEAAPAEGGALLRREIGRHGGQEVTAVAGLLTAAFARANDAVSCAVVCRHAWLTAGSQEAPRMALDTGEVELRDERYHGVVLDRMVRVLLAAHEGQILCSEETAVLLRWDLEPGLRLIDLGLYRLGDLPNVAVFPRPERLFQVEGSDGPPRTFPAPNAEGGYQTHLPLPLTRFFGREEETALLGKLLLASERRLVTLIGPGGSGKTRLALEVAGRLADPFQGAVWFVSLAEIARAELIPRAICDVLHLPPAAGGEPLEPLIAFLSRQPSLLVLDNFEHLVEVGADLVQRLVTRTPALTCLITSRRRLGLDGEREFRVLPLPTPEVTDPPERLMQCESVRLFVDRAQAVQPDFQVTCGTAEAIAGLCRRLEGLPLALELAAARASVLSPAQILSRLDHRLEFLVRQRRDVPARHRSLRAALDGSFQLLAPDLQRFFARLSVFRGGWTLEAAEAVCDDPLALDHLSQLRECSLVLAEAGACETRYRMLETVREYAESMLSREEQAELSRRHAGYFASRAEHAEAEWATEHNAGASGLEPLTREQDNLRAALAWGLGDAGEPEIGVRLAAALWPFWTSQGHLREGRQWLDQALRHAESAECSRTRARLLLGMGCLLQLQGEFASARTFCEESLPLLQAANDPEGTMQALYRLGWVAYHQRDLIRARAYWEETLALRRQAGRIGGPHVWLLRHLCYLVAYLGDEPAAASLEEEELALRRESGGPTAATARLMSGVDRAVRQRDLAALHEIAAEGLALAQEYAHNLEIAAVLDHLGLAARDLGEYGLARALLEQSLVTYRAMDTRINLHLDLWRLAQIARLAGDLGAARACVEESLKVARELGSREPIAHALDELRLVALKQGDWKTALSLPRESLTLWQTLGNSWGLAEAMEGVAHLSIAQGEALAEQGPKDRSQLREAASRTARLLGAAERLRETIRQGLQPHECDDRARSVRAARAVLGDAAFAAAWAEGRALSAEQAVAEALKL
jgi:predicted ATPase/DNA-binding SARP family transcriptional activator